jgi:uncharacterized membrane protein YfhO
MVQYQAMVIAENRIETKDLPIDISHLPTGHYSIQISANEETIRLSFIKALFVLSISLTHLTIIDSHTLLEN